MHDRAQLGHFGEELVITYLKKRGFVILERNYRKRWGEIDLIAGDKEMILFIEVKMRKRQTADFDLAQVIIPSKQKKIIAVAHDYLMRNPDDTKACRFDVALIYGTDAQAAITYLEDAFREYALNNFLQRSLTGIILVFCLWILLTQLPAVIFSCILGIILSVILTTEWPHLIAPSSIYFWLITPIYPILPFVALIMLNQDYHYLLCLLCIIVISHDTGSYLVGSVLGTDYRCPHISPGKSWEGFWGGHFLALRALYLVYYMQSIHPHSWPLLAVVVLITCTLSLNW